MGVRGGTQGGLVILLDISNRCSSSEILDLAHHILRIDTIGSGISLEPCKSKRTGLKSVFVGHFSTGDLHRGRSLALHRLFVLREKNPKLWSGPSSDWA